MSWNIKTLWRTQIMVNKTYSELIENARRKVAWAKASPFANGTELLLVNSLDSIIEALDAINEKIEKRHF